MHAQGQPTTSDAETTVAPYPTSDLFALSGRRALITGGGRGIGLAIAEAMADAGASIVVVDIDAGGEAAAAGLRGRGFEAVFRRCDVTRPAEVEALFDAEPDVDTVVPCAGISARIPAEHYPDDDLERMIDLNVKGVFHVMRAAARRWIEAGRAGRIINIASFAGLVADPLSAPYAATKGAVVQLTRTCAVEWAQRGILVNAIAPGYVRTEMTAETLDSEEGGRRMRMQTPLGRAADPGEIAGAAVFLAAPASSYVTGHILCVDGGWTAL
jgi:gluconate 5-dehydrogenase